MRLTGAAKAGGCASKLSPKILERALKSIPRLDDSRVLVGYDHADDAGVYDLSAESRVPLALVQTVDFFTPIVDDPHTFGAIAAANALSDIYAMGGRPISALSLVVFPGKGDIQVLEQILRGGAEKIHEAGCVILGGHSISEEEIKFGYAVSGLIDPQKIWTNAGAEAGDVIVFTKKLGTGVIASALKSGSAEPEHVNESIEQMLTLNRGNCEVLRELDVHACTDVTGFGLLGHAREMALASNVTLTLCAGSLRFLPGAVEYSRAGFLSGGLHNNRDFVESCVSISEKVDPEVVNLLYDPQTSGGLLVSLEEEQAYRFLYEVEEAYVIGRVAERRARPLEVVV
jgi:selenide,water dikinase